ncbi:hypothetical protein AAVH_15249 [Aphelenchoides avenae]|nr:hypothetical protein AAVH_15249 [Aphelenchus avenae]
MATEGETTTAEVNYYTGATDNDDNCSDDHDYEKTNNSKHHKAFRTVLRDMVCMELRGDLSNG